MRQYPEDVATSTPARWVAHFAHPIELELVSKGHVPMNKYPNMLLQVRWGGGAHSGGGEGRRVHMPMK